MWNLGTYSVTDMSVHMSGSLSRVCVSMCKAWRTRAVRSCGWIFLHCVFLLRVLFFLCLLWLRHGAWRIDPVSWHQSSRVVGGAQRPHDVSDEWLLQFGELRCRAVHEGADGKSQAGFFISLAGQKCSKNIRCVKKFFYPCDLNMTQRQWRAFFNMPRRGRFGLVTIGI